MQPEGRGTPKLLRMQEFGPPWNHWFARSAGGRALMDDYYAAKGDETFAGVDGEDVVLGTGAAQIDHTLVLPGAEEPPDLFVEVGQPVRVGIGDRDRP